MAKIRTLLILGLMLRGSFPEAANADEIVNDPEAARRFQEFCQRLQSPIQTTYQNSTYEVQSVTVRGTASPQIVQSFGSIGGGFTLARTFVPEPGSDARALEFSEGEQLERLGARLTTILNERYFALIGKDEQHRPLLRQLLGVSPGMIRGEESVVYACPVPGARIPFTEIAFAADSDIGVFEEARGASGPVLRLVASFAAKSMEKFGKLSCEAEFDPVVGHCLACKVRIGSSGSNPSFTFEYGKGDSGIPVLRRARVVEASTDVVVESTYRNWQFGTMPPIEECYLKFYGLPEPPDPNAKPSSGIPVWVWPFAAGVGLLGLSVWIRRKLQQAV